MASIYKKPLSNLSYFTKFILEIKRKYAMKEMAFWVDILL